MSRELYVRAGTLRHTVQILRPEYAQDMASGEVVESGPYVVAQVRASIEPLTGRELFVARQSQPEVTHRVCLRWRPDIGQHYSIGYRGRVFHILEILNIDERNRKLELMCVEQVGVS